MRNPPRPNSGEPEKKEQPESKRATSLFCPLRLPRIGAGGPLLALLLLAASAQAAPTHPRVTPADAPALRRAIAAQKGRVVLVNFWATWCGPCVAEFPAIVRVGRQYKPQGLTIIAVSADSMKDLHTKVEPFLAAQGATFPAYLQQSADPQDFINAFDPTWQGDLPRTFIYDRTGRRVKTLSGEQTAQSLAQAVRPYLSRPQKHSPRY